MWIVHIDSWNHADPAKIIDLIPEDVLPYVVFNISLSVTWDATNKKWLRVHDGYETAKSWLRTCAEKGVWAMIQPASGGPSHFPDYDSNTDYEDTIYAEFYRDYPNFIGYNYCEQSWGFNADDPDFPISAIQRYEHFAKLLELSNKYGGYLVVSWCANQYTQDINPIAILERVPNFRDACVKYTENYILTEKFTYKSYIADAESQVLGTYLSGYCGNYGVRYDSSGWSDYPWTGTVTQKQYRLSTSLPIQFERMAFNGATVIDGPELIRVDDFTELKNSPVDDEGYTNREWVMFDQFQNDVIDFMRKLIDGTVRIPSRQEVVDRTKVVIIQDVSSGNNDDKYSTYPTLFEGLYRVSTDGNLKDNHNIFKSTGRYPTIPTVYALRDDVAKSFDVQIKQSSIASRWSSISAKQNEFNKLFASEYTGNCFAGRYENAWLTYNPSKTGETANGTLDLKYNTCEKLGVDYTEYATGVIKEYSDHIDIYLNNYDEDANTTLKTNKISIHGASAKPSFTYTDRGVNQVASVVSESWSNGVYTLTVQHNGPLDITINCAGNATGRLTSYKTATLVEPTAPSQYYGIQQYEGELFDRMNVEGNVANGCNTDITGFQGQGFMKFGTKETAAVKDTVTAKTAGTYNMTIRYSATSNITGVDLYVNGERIKSISFPKGSSLSDWKTVSAQIPLNEGENKVEMKATQALASTLYIDNFTLMKSTSGKIFRNLEIREENAADWSIDYNFGVGSLIYGDRDIACTAMPEALEGTEYIKSACDSKASLLDLGTCKVSRDANVYVAVDTRVVSALPAWLSSWTAIGENITAAGAFSGDLTFALYQKAFKAGETITLGTNGGKSNSANYFVLAEPVSVKTMSGKLIQSLEVYDADNADDWSIDYNFGVGSLLYGDRDITCTSVPEILENAEYIKSACDSKASLLDLGYCTVAKDMNLYIAVDTRVVTSLPTWLEYWTDTGLSMTASNDLTFAVYQRSVKAGEIITLGTNSGKSNSANYVVLAESDMVRGDVNADGVFDMADIVMMQKYLVGVGSLTDPDAGNLCEDDRINVFDFGLMKRELLK